MQEREQKRQYETSGNILRDGLAWTYTLLGGDKKQLATYNGVQGEFCGQNAVWMWPVEHNSYGPAQTRIITRPNGFKEFVIPDHLGSSRLTISAEGDVLQRSDYEPFGSSLANEGVGSRTSYIGREEDGESGLGFYGVRLYEPEYGRFTSVDPLWAEMIGWNPFHYSHANPVGLKDGSGLADFFDQEGNKVGSNGVDDGKRYISDKANYESAAKGKVSFDVLVDNQVAMLVPSLETLGEIQKHVINQANNPIQNDREHGGIVGEDGAFYPSSPGPRYAETGRAEMSLSESYSAMDASGTTAALKVHSHPNFGDVFSGTTSNIQADTKASSKDIKHAKDAPGIVLYPSTPFHTSVSFYNENGHQFSTTFKVLKDVAGAPK
jgi:RHS repeat-associated protein